jgi:hypothetical protein
VAIVQVNDVSDEVNEEQSRKVGGLNIYAKDVFYLGKESQVSSATLQLGSQKLTLENTKEVKITIGTDDSSIDNTLVSISGSADVSSIEVRWQQMTRTQNISQLAHHSLTQYSEASRLSWAEWFQQPVQHHTKPLCLTLAVTTTQQ